jgi:RNA polymerase sigma-32 factor
MNNSLCLKTPSLPVPVEGMPTYLQQVNAIPLLTEEEELTYAREYREDGNLYAAEQLVLSHLRYVVKVARLYSGYGLGLADLIQEGTIGLMKAVKRFDPDKGVRLVSFAVHWIKSEIHEFVIRNWRIVKVATTKAQRKLFFNLRQAKKRLGWFSREEVNAVAEDLGVSPKEVLEMESRLNAHDDSFDYPDLNEGESQVTSPIQYLPAPQESEPAHYISEENWQDSGQEKLLKALESLDPRSRDIVMERWMNESKTAFKILAEKHDISIERVRQLEKSAIEKLRHVVTT